MCSKSRKHSKSRKRSKSRAHSKSRARSKSKGGAWKPGLWPSCQKQSPSKGHQEKENKPCKESSKTCGSPLLPSYSYEQLRARNNRSTEHLAPTNHEQSKHDKLKEEVVKWPHEYIRGHTMLIAHTLAPNHEAIKCLVAFGENALKYATEILATIKWGTQHWQLQEPFPVLPVPKWLYSPQMMQTMTPLRGELPLPPSGTHIRDIHIRSPTLWQWMAVLFHFWKDHMTEVLFGGCVCQASDLSNTLIHDINPWLSHKARFG